MYCQIFPGHDLSVGSLWGKESVYGRAGIVEEGSWLCAKGLLIGTG